MNAHSMHESSRATRAEAAAWVARLHGPKRTREAEAGFARWIAESRERAAAFEFVTDTWEKSARLRRCGSTRTVVRGAFPVRMAYAGAAVFGIVVVAVAALVILNYYPRSHAFVTAIGEQRTVTLDDGTRLSLNTNSSAVVRFDRAARCVELKSGEVLFDVSPHAGWPFVVVAGDMRVRAFGTAFVVRSDPGVLTVTLVEGVVAVESNQSGEHPSAGTMLRPGQRLTLAHNAASRLDTVVLDEVMAWRHGQVTFDNISLAEAVAEMNRYSTMRLTVDEPAGSDVRISGIFRAGDSANFALAVASSYHLQVRSGVNEIKLVRPVAGQGGGAPRSFAGP